MYLGYTLNTHKKLDEKLYLFYNYTHVKHLGLFYD